MIKYSSLPANILQVLPNAVEYLLENKDVVFAYLFGGFAKGKITPLSDLDIAIYLAKDEYPAEKKLKILSELTRILGTEEIDLVILNSASLPLVMTILQSKKVIVDKEPFKRHLFESLVMRKYYDFSVKETAILERRYLRG